MKILLILALAILAIGINFSQRFRAMSFTFWIFTVVAAAMFYPQYFKSIGNYSLSNLIVPLLQIIMFGMGTTMSLNDFKGVIKMPKAVLIGVICQFSIMPIIGFGLAYLFNFPAEIAAGLILVGSSPSGLASNVMAFIAKANIALSITLTTIATLLAPLVTPILMKYLAGQFIPIDFWAMMSSITKMVIIPIVAGLLFNRFFKTPFQWQAGKTSMVLLGILLSGGSILAKIFIEPSNMLVLAFELLWISGLAVGVAILLEKIIADPALVDKALPIISMAGIAFIIIIITAAGRDSLQQVGLLLILACFLHNIAGYTLGYYACRLVGLDIQSARTIALEVGLQNSGLASGIAKEMGRLATVGLAPAVFGPLMNITGSSLASWWSKESKS